MLLHFNCREYLGVGDLGDGLAGVQELELHEEGEAGDARAQALDELDLRNGGAARGHEVVDDEHDVGAVVESRERAS